jgi:hypothetical protein
MREPVFGSKIVLLTMPCREGDTPVTIEVCEG